MKKLYRAYVDLNKPEESKFEEIEVKKEIYYSYPFDTPYTEYWLSKLVYSPKLYPNGGESYVFLSRYLGEQIALYGDKENGWQYISDNEEEVKTKYKEMLNNARINIEERLKNIVHELSTKLTKLTKLNNIIDE